MVGIETGAGVGSEGIARRLGAGKHFKSGAGEVLAGFEDEAFKFSDAAGVGCFLFERFEDGLHVLVKVGHGLSLQVPICGCTQPRHKAGLSYFCAVN